MTRSPHTPPTSAADSSVSELLSGWAERAPQAIALRYKRRGLWHERKTGELCAEVAQLSASLRARGLRAGSGLALLGVHAPELLVAALAALRLGAHVVLVESGAEHARLREVLASGSVSFALAEDWTALEALLSPGELLGTTAHGLTLAVVQEGAGSAELHVESYARWLAFGADRPSPHLLGHPTSQALAVEAYPADPAAPATRYRHAALLATPEPERHPAPRELLVLDDVVGPSLLTHGLRLWLAANATLNLPEPHGNVLRDLREIGPNILIASRRRLEALQDAVQAHLPAPGSWRRRWIERALAGSGPQSARGVFDAWLIRAPLRRHLGLSRLHALRVGPEDVTDAHGALRSLLGVTAATSPVVEQTQLQDVERAQRQSEQSA